MILEFIKKVQTIAPKLEKIILVADLLSVPTRAIIVGNISHSLTVPLELIMQSVFSGDD